MAIFPPKETLDGLRDALRKFDKQRRNLKPIPVDQMHLTLKFLGGNVSEYSMDIINHAFHELQNSFPKPLIEIKQVQFGFEKEHNPWILIAKIKRNPELVELQNQVHDVIKSLKLKDTIRFKRRYAHNMHITLGRMKRTGTKSTGKMIAGIAKSNKDSIKIEPFVPERFSLMESVITNTGPVYKPLNTFNL